MIVAQKLGVSPDDVDVLHSDTAISPLGLDTYGSRSLAVGGIAIYQAIYESELPGVAERRAALRGHELDVRSVGLGDELRNARRVGSVEDLLDRQIAKLVGEMSDAHSGNDLVLFPSYRFLGEVAAVMPPTMMAGVSRAGNAARKVAPSVRQRNTWSRPMLYLRAQ